MLIEICGLLTIRLAVAAALDGGTGCGAEITSGGGFFDGIFCVFLFYIHFHVYIKYGYISCFTILYAGALCNFESTTAMHHKIDGECNTFIWAFALAHWLYNPLYETGIYRL